MISTGWFATGSIALAVAAWTVSGVVHYGRGVKDENAKWEQVNVEELRAANAALTKDNIRLQTRAAFLESQNAEAATQTGDRTTRTIERIREVPVERIVTVSESCDVSYGAVELFNSWAEGSGDDPGS